MDRQEHVRQDPAPTGSSAQSDREEPLGVGRKPQLAAAGPAPVTGARRMRNCCKFARDWHGSMAVQQEARIAAGFRAVGGTGLEPVTRSLSGAPAGRRSLAASVHVQSPGLVGASVYDARSSSLCSPVPKGSLNDPPRSRCRVRRDTSCSRLIDRLGRDIPVRRGVARELLRRALDIHTRPFRRVLHLPKRSPQGTPHRPVRSVVPLHGLMRPARTRAGRSRPAATGCRSTARGSSSPPSSTSALGERPLW